MGKQKPDAGHQHESLHTAHVLMCAWNDHVTDSLFVHSRKSLRKKAERAAGAMMDLYQAVGAASADTQTRADAKGE